MPYYHNDNNNFLLADGHAEKIRYPETVGEGPYDKPKGMWTRGAGD